MKTLEDDMMTRSWIVVNALLQLVDFGIEQHQFLDLPALRTITKWFEYCPTEMDKFRQVLDNYIEWAVDNNEAKTVLELTKMKYGEGNNVNL